MIVRTIVRRAELGDMDWLISRFKLAAEYYPTKLELYPGDSNARDRLAEVMINHLMLVSERDGVLTGYIGGLVVPHFFNSEIKTLTQILWWVDEEYRCGPSAKNLLDAFNEYGSKYCHWTFIILHKGSNVKEQYFLKNGYSIKEQTYMKEIL